MGKSSSRKPYKTNVPNWQDKRLKGSIHLASPALVRQLSTADQTKATQTRLDHRVIMGSWVGSFWGTPPNNNDGFPFGFPFTTTSPQTTHPHPSPPQQLFSRLKVSFYWRMSATLNRAGCSRVFKPKRSKGSSISTSGTLRSSTSTGTLRSVERRCPRNGNQLIWEKHPIGSLRIHRRVPSLP